MEMKSPIKAKPLRYPGESLDQEIRRLQDDMLFKYLIYAIFLFAVACLEWLRFATNAPPDPWPYTVVAFAVIVFITIKVVQIRKRIRLLRLGRDGERAVGEYLEKLRVNGYAVFHDIVGEGFNIDHVVCAPSGIYAIETKTRSKPVKGAARIVYDGKRILIDGWEMDRDPLIQSKSQAEWLKGILLQSTGKKFPVKPVVLFPGWYIESKGSQNTSTVWVLNPKALPAFIESADPKLAESDLHMVSFHLSRYIRSQPS